ncbi:MAG: hypothetical protein J0M29_11830 [Chitinophagales bacterium]|nr:hypothetical protein [Chitinophagales bacterium]
MDKLAPNYLPIPATPTPYKLPISEINKNATFSHKLPTFANSHVQLRKTRS